MGSLQSNVISKVVLQRYAVCFNALCLYFKTTGGLPRGLHEFDLRCQTYLESLWEDGEPRSKAAYTLSAAQHFMCQTKHNLTGSWRLISAWEKLEMPQRCIPFTLQVTFALAGILWQWEEREPALALVVAFGLLLRTGELFLLRVNWCQFSASLSECVIRFHDTKGLHLNHKKVEEVVLREPVTLRALWLLCAEKLPGAPVLSCNVYHFRRLFQRALKHFRLSGKYQPYSLRRGGATEYFKQTGSFDKVMELGRWQNLKTCRIYVQDAMATSASIEYDANQRQLFKTVGERFLTTIMDGHSQVGMHGRAKAQSR